MDGQCDWLVELYNIILVVLSIVLPTTCSWPIPSATFSLMTQRSSKGCWLVFGDSGRDDGSCIKSELSHFYRKNFRLCPTQIGLSLVVESSRYRMTLPELVEMKVGEVNFRKSQLNLCKFTISNW